MLKFYYDLISQPARALLIFMRVAGVPHKECPIQLRKGEHLTEEFAKINPLKKVPAIEHDGFRLSESVAIFKYLSRQFQVADHWYPSDIKEAAYVDQFLCWQATNLRLNGTEYFRTKMVIPRQTNEKVDETKLAFHAAELDKNLTEIEDHFLDGKHLGSKDLAVSDLLALCEIYQPWASGFDTFSNHPRLSKWADDTKSKLQPHFDDIHKVLYKIRESTGK